MKLEKKILFFVHRSCSKQRDSTDRRELISWKTQIIWRGSSCVLPGHLPPSTPVQDPPLKESHSLTTALCFSVSWAASMRFEDVLEVVGGFSRFQLLTLCILCLPRAILPLHFLLHNFVSATPPHWCASPEVTALPLEVSPPPLQDRAVGSCPVYNGNGSVSCTDGWTYDRSQFTSTTATEVDLSSSPACPPSLPLDSG